jgi:hypothetical protein
MVNTSSHPITVEGVRLDTLAWNIEVKTGWDLGQSARGGNSEVPGMDGEIWTPNKREAAGRIGLQMWVQGADANGVVATDRYEAYRQNLDTLRFLFGKRHKLLTVQHTIGSTVGTRECLAEVVEAFDPTVTGMGQIGRFNVLLRVPGVYWRDTADLTYDLNPATTGQKTLTAFAGATANMRDGILVFDGPWTNPSVIDDATGHVLQLNATVASGSQWNVDCAAFTSKTGAGIAFTSGGTQAMLSTTRSGAHAPGLFGVTPAGSVAPTVTLGGSGLTAASRFRFRARRKYR